MSESSIAVSPTGSTLLRTYSGSIGGTNVHDEIIQIAEPVNRNRIDPRDQGNSGSVAWPVDIDNIVTTVKTDKSAYTSGQTKYIWLPAANKKIRLKGYAVSVTGQSVIDLLFSGSTGAIDSYYFAGSGSSIAVNLVGSNIDGANNEGIKVISSAAITIASRFLGDEI